MKNVFVRQAALSAAFACLTWGSVQADEGTVRADTHAPLGVMGDHTHNKGEWMFSYRFMRMDMDGNRDGTHQLTVNEVLERYMVSPVKMTTDMHMFGAMYAPSNRLTLMAMLPFLDKSMDHQTRMGGLFTTETSGLGDAKLEGLFRILHQPEANAHLTLGLSIPTGDIKETGLTPMGNVRLPYPMQLGSGTWDIRAAATYNGLLERWSWGSQASMVIRTGKNDQHYRLGNKGQVSTWLAKPLTSFASVSSRLSYQQWGNISGADPSLNPMMVPTADPSLRAGKRLDFGLGMNFLFSGGHRLALEYLLPIYQHLDGPQLEQDGMLSLGYQFTPNW